MQTRITRNLIFALIVVSLTASAATVSRITTFSDGDILTAGDLNSELNNVVNGVNSISDDNVATNAAITPSKIATSIAGAGVARDSSTGALAVNVDNVGLEVSGDTVQLKDAGVTLAKLATSTINSLMPTGAMVPYVGTTAPTGWVLANGGTIGNAASGATLRANADAETLYALLYDSFTNTVLPIQDSAGVATTRGASAAADFAANKRLPVPDMRGRVAAGDDDMGGVTAASRLTATAMSPNGITMGATGGTQTHTLTTAEMPNHNHTLTDPGHNHTITIANNDTAGLIPADGSVGYTQSITTSNATTGITLAATGGGGAHLNTQPTIITSYIIKL